MILTMIGRNSQEGMLIEGGKTIDDGDQGILNTE